MNLGSLRPFQIILIATFAFLALIGLVLFATYKGHSDKTAQVGSVTIWGILPGSVMQPVLDTYKGNHPELGKVFYSSKQAATFDTELADALASGQGPDLILISQEQLLAEENKLQVIPYATIPQRGYLSTYIPEAELFLTNSGTYGIPFLADPLVLYYNRDILSSNGIATPPSSWEAVTGLAAALTQHAGANITRSAIALGQYNNVDNARAIISLLLLQSGSSITSASDGTLRSTLTLSSDSSGYGASPAQSAMNFFTQFADPAKTVYSWNSSLPSARQQFLAGNNALYIGFASEEPILKQSNPNLNFDMARIPQPQTSTTRIDYGNLYAFAIPKASKNSSGALLAASELAGSVAVEQAAPLLSMAPALRGALTPSASDPFQAVYYPEALIMRGWLSPLPAVTDSIFSAMITNMITGRKNTSDSLQTADQALDSAL